MKLKMLQAKLSVFELESGFNNLSFLGIPCILFITKCIKNVKTVMSRVLEEEFIEVHILFVKHSVVEVLTKVVDL